MENLQSKPKFFSSSFSFNAVFEMYIMIGINKLIQYWWVCYRSSSVSLVSIHVCHILREQQCEKKKKQTQNKDNVGKNNCPAKFE